MKSILFLVALIHFAEVAGSFNKDNILFRIFTFLFRNLIFIQHFFHLIQIAVAVVFILANGTAFVIFSIVIAKLSIPGIVSTHQV